MHNFQLENDLPESRIGRLRTGRMVAVIGFLKKSEHTTLDGLASDVVFCSYDRIPMHANDSGDERADPKRIGLRDRADFVAVRRHPGRCIDICEFTGPFIVL